MDNIWDKKIRRSRSSLAVVAGMKKTNDHAEPTKVWHVRYVRTFKWSNV